MRTPRSSALAALLCAALVACASDHGDDGIDSASFAATTEHDYSVSAGINHTCALVGGTVQCWGTNSYGQLGDGTTVDSSTPVTVVGITTAVAVTAGRYNSCALLADGKAKCWGYGGYGQLGNGSTLDRTTPVTVSGLANAQSLSAGGYHTCASLVDGTARCWGYNLYGELGNNGTTNTSTAVTVVAPSTKGTMVALGGIVEIETGLYATCARLTSGAVRCWGRNNYGQLGDGTNTNRLTPVAVSAITTAAELSVGSYHACAVVGAGRARCWGQNVYGQLGDGTMINRSTPVSVQWQLTPALKYPLTGITTVAAGGRHTCLLSGGNIWCMGDNGDGQLGQDASGIIEPLAEGTVIAAEEVSGGGYHTCARRPGGVVVCFGQDTYGQVGDFGLCPRNPVATLLAVKSIDGQVLAQPGDLYYTATNTVDIALETTVCATVSDVVWTWGSLGADDPVEPGDGIWYETVSTQDFPDGMRELWVRVHFSNPGNGMTFPASVTLASPAGNTASAGFTLSEVQAVNANGGVVTLARDELYNDVISGLYEKWGDYNYYDRSSYPDLYALDYEHIEFTMDASGISFDIATKADIGLFMGACNPEAYAEGKFTVILDSDGNPAVHWVDYPAVDVDFPLLCDIATVGIANAIVEGILVFYDDNVARKVENKIAGLKDHCTAIGCASVLKSITHVDGGLAIELNPLYPSVTFVTPYNSSQIDEASVGDPMRRGIALPAGRASVIVAGGVAEACASTTGACDTYDFGAAGLFNWDWAGASSPALPIPYPWPECGMAICPDYYGREDAWHAQRGLTRAMDTLPMPEQSPGGVLVRMIYEDGTASTLRYAGGGVCGVDSGEAAQARLVVGRNDVHLAGPYTGEYGTGDAIITIGFDQTWANAAGACPE